MNDLRYILSKCALAVVMMLAFVFSAYAQNTLTGRVTDENGNALPGVYVLVKGTQNATSTDANGNFSLRVNSSATALVFSMMGMEEHGDKPCLAVDNPGLEVPENVEYIATVRKL